MKYLSKVTLKNFQSHKNTVIEFKQGLNVIVGPSDTGKSSVIRGIKWALYNEPSGDFFIREGESECSVIIEFNDGIIVERLRNKSKNMYILHDDKGNKIKYEGFGTSVPEEIMEVIGIKKIYLDSDESNTVNIGEQLEGPFLLSEKDSTKASAIGRLIGVNIIDEALREALKDLRDFNNQKKVIDEKINELNNELKSYEYLDKLSRTNNRLNKIKDDIKEKDQKLRRLRVTKKNFNETQMEIKELKIYLKKLSNLEIVEDNLKNINYLLNNYKYIKNKDKSLVSYYNEINININILKQLSEINAIDKNYNELNNFIYKQHRLTKIRRDYKSNQTEISNINKLNIDLVKVNQSEENSILIDRYIDKLKEYKQIQKRLMKNRDRLNIGSKYIDKFKNIDRILEVYQQIEFKLKTFQNYRLISNQLECCQKDLRKEKKQENDMEKNIKSMLQRYEELLKDIEVCPFCLSNIDNDKIKHIVKHYGSVN